MIKLIKPDSLLLALFAGSLLALALTIFGISFPKLSFFTRGEHVSFTVFDSTKKLFQDTLLLSLQVAAIVLCVLFVLAFAFLCFHKGFPEGKPDLYVIGLCELIGIY
jgi:ABC-type spermidine/putrescine transport system permease subunit I